MDDYFVKASDSHCRKEKEKARQLRRSQWWRQQLGKGVCYYCEQTFPKEELTMDHVLPIIRGGKTNKKNVVVCCKVCNNEKKYYTPAEVVMNKLKKTDDIN